VDTRPQFHKPSGPTMGKRILEWLKAFLPS
jgi:hypothetical protein